MKVTDIRFPIPDSRFPILVFVALFLTSCFLFPVLTFAAVAVDSVGPSSAGAAVADSSTLSWSHTVSGSNTLLTVGVAVGKKSVNISSYTISVTYAGVLLTSASRLVTSTAQTGIVQLFYIKNPTPGTNTVQVTISGGTADIEAGSVSFSGVDQTTSVRNITLNNGQSTSATVTVPSATSNMTVSVASAGDSITGSGNTSRWMRNQNFFSAAGNGAQSTAPGASSVNMSYTLNSDYWGIIGMDVIADAGGVTPTPSPTPSPTPTPIPTPTPTPVPSGNTITAASCSQANVQSAINSITSGGTVIVPAGTCSWAGGLSILGIQLIGAGKSTSGTVITSGSVSMTKHVSQYTRVSGFRFTGSDTHITVGGSASNKSFIIDNNYLFTGGSGDMVDISVNGGLLHHNDFVASSPTNADVFGITTGENWSQAPTFGNQDTTGERNIYFEDNTFNNILETAPDGDVGGRFVIRYNTYTDSSIVWHGGAPNDSSPGGGTRQFEIYNNTFNRVSNAAPMNKWIWVRGSTGVIANNNMQRVDSPDGSSYPNKSEIRLTLACPSGYPMQYQVGQSNQTPENPPSRPLLIFGNTGAGSTDGNFITVGSSDTAGGSCANPQNYIQVGRDYMLSNTWGWVPYTYPHPLQSFSGVTPTPSPSPTPTPTPTPVPGDINLDHVVNTLDYSILNSHWLQNYATADLKVDGLVNSFDFAILKNNWGLTW